MFSLPYFILIFPDSPLIFSILPYFALFFPNFLTRKGGMLLDAIFSPRILFFFLYSRGAWLRGKQKNLFFLVLTFTPVRARRQSHYGILHKIIYLLGQDVNSFLRLACLKQRDCCVYMNFMIILMIGVQFNVD